MTQKIKKIIITSSLLAPFFISAQVFAVLPGGSPAPTPTPSTPAPNVSSNPIVKDIQSVVDFLSIGVGVVVVGAIVLGAVQYIMAGDNPQAVGAAKSRITNGLLALVAFLFLFAFLQWVIPGGAFSS